MFSESTLKGYAEEALRRAKRKGMDAAEVELTQEHGFSVSARAGDVENLEHHQERGFVITVYQNKRSGSACTSDFSPETLRSTVEKACALAQFGGEDECYGLPEKSRLAEHYPDLALYHPWDITPAQAIEKAIQCDEIARAQDSRIGDAEGASVSTYDSFRLFANSDGFMGFYPRSSHSISCSVIAEENGAKEVDYDYTSSRRPELLDDIDYIAKRAAEKTVRRLGARKIKTTTCPVIFNAPLAKGLLGAFIGAISGSNLYRKSTFLLDHIDKRVFPEFINIYQQPHLLSGIGSAPFDSDGGLTHDLHYIREGVLKSYALGTYSSRRLGLEPTGNSGGIYNLTLTHQNLSLQKLFQEMGTGLFITDMMGQGVKLITGDYSRGAAGYWIENGEIQFPVHEVTVAGNLRDMFLGIRAVANDIDTRGNVQTGSILINKMTIAGD